MAHSRLKDQFFNVAIAGQPAVPIRFTRAWWDPLAWTLSQFDWSPRHVPTDNLQERRQNSISWVELAIVANLLTGGAIGPLDASFSVKAALVKYGTTELIRVLGFSNEENGPSVPNAPVKPALRCTPFVVPLKTCEAAAPCGFVRLPGLDRRINLGKFPHLTTAVGTLLCYAKAHGDGLNSRMPSVSWFKELWKPSQLVTTMEQMARCRRGEDPIQPDLVPRNAKLKALKETEAKSTGKSEEARAAKTVEIDKDGGVHQ
jgi:hypothetical protein